jgi:hypothetical protein
MRKQLLAIKKQRDDTTKEYACCAHGFPSGRRYLGIITTPVTSATTIRNLMLTPLCSMILTNNDAGSSSVIGNN